MIGEWLGSAGILSQEATVLRSMGTFNQWAGMASVVVYVLLCLGAIAGLREYIGFRMVLRCFYAGRAMKHIGVVDASVELKEIAKLVERLENARENKSKVLFCITELEAVLGKLEEKARDADKKYEGRLAGCLRDVCWVNEPSGLSVEQIERFCACLKALVGGWDKLDREEVKCICERLLEVELTWLPVTGKVAKKTPNEPKLDQ
jgi:hypothetical protein